MPARHISAAAHETIFFFFFYKNLAGPATCPASLPLIIRSVHAKNFRGSLARSLVVTANNRVWKNFFLFGDEVTRSVTDSGARAHGEESGLAKKKKRDHVVRHHLVAVRRGRNRPWGCFAREAASLAGRSSGRRETVGRREAAGSRDWRRGKHRQRQVDLHACGPRQDPGRIGCPGEARQ